MDHSLFQHAVLTTLEYLTALLASINCIPGSLSSAAEAIKTSLDLDKYSLEGQNHCQFYTYKNFHLSEFQNCHFL